MTHFVTLETWTLTCSIDGVFEQNLEHVLKNVLRSLVKSPKARRNLQKGPITEQDGDDPFRAKGK